MGDRFAGIFANFKNIQEDNKQLEQDLIEQDELRHCAWMKLDGVRSDCLLNKLYTSIHHSYTGKGCGCGVGYNHPHYSHQIHDTVKLSKDKIASRIRNLKAVGLY